MPELGAGTGGATPEPDAAALAAWSMARGLTTVNLTGDLPPTADLAGLTRAVLHQLVVAPRV